MKPAMTTDTSTTMTDPKLEPQQSTDPLGELIEDFLRQRINSVSDEYLGDDGNTEIVLSKGVVSKEETNLDHDPSSPVIPHHETSTPVLDTLSAYAIISSPLVMSNMNDSLEEQGAQKNESVKLAELTALGKARSSELRDNSISTSNEEGQNDKLKEMSIEKRDSSVYLSIKTQEVNSMEIVQNDNQSKGKQGETAEPANRLTELKNLQEMLSKKMEIPEMSNSKQELKTKSQTNQIGQTGRKKSNQQNRRKEKNPKNLNVQNNDRNTNGSKKNGELVTADPERDANPEVDDSSISPIVNEGDFDNRPDKKQSLHEDENYEEMQLGDESTSSKEEPKPAVFLAHPSETAVYNSSYESKVSSSESNRDSQSEEQHLDYTDGHRKRNSVVILESSSKKEILKLANSFSQQQLAGSIREIKKEERKTEKQQKKDLRDIKKTLAPGKMKVASQDPEDILKCIPINTSTAVYINKISTTTDDWVYKNALASNEKPWHPTILLTTEIREFIERIEPLPKETSTRQRTINKVSTAIKSLYHDADVKCFGSCASNLCIPSSDIDMVVFSKDGSYKYSSKESLTNLGYFLHGRLPDVKIEIVASAKVPILKVTDCTNNMHVDISMERTKGVKDIALFRSWTKTTPGLRELVLVVKQFLSERGINVPYTGGLSGISITTLVYAFLKNHPMIQNNQIDPLENLGELLVDFFGFYGRSFEFREYGVEFTHDGKPVFSRKKASHNLCRPQFEGFAIEDANDVDRNLAYSMKPFVITAFNIAFNTLVDRCNDWYYLQHSLGNNQTILNYIIKYDYKHRWS